MARINDRKGQLNRWLKNIFPPSSPRYAQPNELEEIIRLYMPALPPSLVYERMGYQTGVTVNPATQLFFPSTAGDEAFGAVEAGVPLGEYYWVLGARFESSVAAPSTGGKAFIGLKHVGDPREVGMSQGFLGASLLDFVDLHSLNIVSTPAQMGGGVGPTVIPPTYNLHFSTGATPAATTLFNATIVYCRLTIGELHP